MLEEYPAATPAGRRKSLSGSTRPTAWIWNLWWTLTWSRNATRTSPTRISRPDGDDVPELLQLSPLDLLSRLAQLHSGYRVTLNLTNLKVEEVLELLYDCQGMITRWKFSTSRIMRPEKQGTFQISVG
jgi:hypothetical protein